MLRKKKIELKPEVLEGAPLRYAPQNELGVVFLFAHIARRKGLKIDEIKPGFPDCIAYKNTGKGEKKIRIEFEYKSRNFLQQGHDPKGCDCIVCWEHNWPGKPRNIEVIELRKEFGLGFNVWIQPVNVDHSDEFEGITVDEWSVSSEAHKGDLILSYHATPKKYISDIFILVSDVKLYLEAEWKKGKDYMGDVRRICKLKDPIRLDDLRKHEVLKTSSFVRSCMRGRARVTEYWPYLYDMIIKRNRDVMKQLQKYSPDRL